MILVGQGRRQLFENRLFDFSFEGSRIVVPLSICGCGGSHPCHACERGAYWHLARMSIGRQVESFVVLLLVVLVLAGLGFVAQLAQKLAVVGEVPGAGDQ